MDQDGSDFPNHDPVGAAPTSTSDADVQQPQRTQRPLVPEPLTSMALNQQIGGATRVIEDPRRLWLPPVNRDGTLITDKEPRSDGAPTTDATGWPPARTPFMLGPQPKPSSGVRWFLILFSLFYSTLKLIWWTVSLTVLFVLPGLASSYAGNAICQSLGFAHYRLRVADGVVIGILGSFVSLFIIMIPCFVLFTCFPFDSLFGPRPKRLFSPSTGSTATITEDPPFLFLCFPVVYLHAFLSIVPIMKTLKLEDSAGERLSRREVARVVALGALPVSVLYVLIMPFVVAFAQCVDRAINNWKRGIAKRDRRPVYENSLLQAVVYQYTFFFKRRKESTAQPPLEDGAA